MEAQTGQTDRKAALHGRIGSDFTYHAPKEGQNEKYVALRGKAHELATMMVDLVPDGRELSTALTRLEESVMHANAGISRHG